MLRNAFRLHATYVSLFHMQLEYLCCCKHDAGIIACVNSVHALPSRTHRSNSNVVCTTSSSPGGSPTSRVDMVQWVLNTSNGLGLDFETASQAVVMVDRLMEKLPPMDSVGPNITRNFLQATSIFLYLKA